MKKFIILIFILGVGGLISLAYFLPQEDYSLPEEKFLESDCFPGEKYDPQEQACYIECETDEECAKIEERIAQIAEEIGDDYFEGEKEYAEPAEPEEQTVAEYEVRGNELSPQPNDPRHQEVWNYFVKLVPQRYRADVVGFDIFSDGKEGTYAAVYQDDKEPLKWRLAVDVEDAYDEQKINDRDLTYSLIHEQGHLLTLNKDQVEFNLDISRIENEEEAERAAQTAREKCQPRYFTGEGCSKENSYINLFFQQFWGNLYEEWLVSEPENFYQKNQDQFLTEHASSDPTEDIAESWTAFVLKDKPSAQKVTDSKILIFYNYPELTVLRQAIRNRFINLVFRLP